MTKMTAKPFTIVAADSPAKVWASKPEWLAIKETI
jgi:hypothetical protein